MSIGRLITRICVGTPGTPHQFGDNFRASAVGDPALTVPFPPGFPLLFCGLAGLVMARRHKR
jgi:hypothetical protein